MAVTRMMPTAQPGRRYVVAGVGAEEEVPPKTESDIPEPSADDGQGKGPRGKMGIGHR